MKRKNRYFKGVCPYCKNSIRGEIHRAKLWAFNECSLVITYLCLKCGRETVHCSEEVSRKEWRAEDEKNED